MIITRTPFRISFVGGGSDLPSFYQKHPGAVLSTSINKYMYISSHRFFEADKVRVKYSKTETVENISRLEHPIFREVFKKFGVEGGIEFSSIADVPAGTGMGSSSSFTVGLLNNLYAGRGNEISKSELAKEACHIEIDLLGEPIGKQDQYAAAFGGLNILRFQSDESVSVEKIDLSAQIQDHLQDNLVLFYTGSQRSASKILSEQKASLDDKDKFNLLVEMTSLVDDLRDSLIANNIGEFGRILNANWEMKRSLTRKISNSAIDDAYSLALKNGAIGGKLLGAGGGGFLLFVCPPEHQSGLASALKLRKFDFSFDNEGSKVIYFADEN